MRPPALDHFQGAHIAEHAVLSVFPHRTGVEKNKIRLVRPLGKTEAHGGQHPFHPFGIRYVLLTAIGAQAAQRRRVAALLIILPDALDIGFLPAPFVCRRSIRFPVVHTGSFSSVQAGL